MCVKGKYRIIFKTFFLVLLVQFLKKNNNSKFSWLALLFKHFFIKIRPNVSEQEKKWQRIYDSLYAETKPDQNFLNLDSGLLCEYGNRTK